MADDNNQSKWMHDQEISFKRATEYLVSIRDALQQLVRQQKQELERMVGARDAVRK